MAAPVAALVAAPTMAPTMAPAVAPAPAPGPALYVSNPHLHVGKGPNGVVDLKAKQLAVEWMARRGELCLQPRHGKKNVLKSQYVDALLALTGEKALLLESFVAPLNWQEAAAPDSILNNLVDFMIGSTKDRTFKPARLSQAEQENLQQLKGTQAGVDFINKIMGFYQACLLRLLRDEKSISQIALTFRVSRFKELSPPRGHARSGAARSGAGGLYIRLADIIGTRIEDGSMMLSMGLHTVLSQAENEVLFRAFCKRLPGNTEGEVKLPGFNALSLSLFERGKVYDVMGWVLSHATKPARLSKLTGSLKGQLEEFAGINTLSCREAKERSLPTQVIEDRDKRKDSAKISDSTFVSNALYEWALLVEWACLSTINLRKVVQSGNSSYLAKVKAAILKSKEVTAAFAAANIDGNAETLKDVHKILLNTFMNMRGRDAWKSIVERGQEQERAQKTKGKRKAGPRLRDGAGEGTRTRVMCKGNGN